MADGRPGRARLPVGPRFYKGRESRVVCISTNLSPPEIAELDRMAAAVDETRAEYIRRAVHERIARERKA